MKKLTLLVTALYVAVALFAAISTATAQEEKKAELNKPAPAFTLTDVEGKAHSLADLKGRIVVLEWVNFDCPFVRKYYNAGAMQALQKKYAQPKDEDDEKPTDVAWLVINSSAKGEQGHLTPEQAKEAIKKEKVQATAFLFDTDGKVGRTYGARTTPHMYVINKEGVLVYNGAIDDKPTARAQDLEGAKNYVALAIAQLRAGEKVEIQSTPPYGCNVKY